MAPTISFVSPALHPKAEALPFSSLPPPPSGSGSGSYRSRGNLLFSPSKSKHSISISRLASNPPPSTPEKPPEIELEFVGPKAGEDGSYPVDRASAISGEKLLRNIMLDNKIELYAAYGKVMNCGGGGSCGTCIVEIIDGMELLNEKTDTEKRYLKKKPESWRLACQTIVGNKENAGKVIVQRMPQWKK
ncbi:photosynthetic NDH subunit of subcomplex B 3, chloroplastic isoform X3 [Elaeis guineensis]|uniref:Photosynthetic NDH subunit of subcomplex B 3, chloroplastic isoform X2 n=1 Tax=Elaeis guineensis var. tenera TaxID=51953 RepID=A0A6I9QR44_ELAGV|nr:photosynthetic NDH subunit of subcomplex B 3, chloroplastic isoform X2 [Elaeis guineensis]XP_010914030.1 photosynthetic NDH subunit of subcomplex B 3, chloroplastic isoform X2 [Elaeis guineensis]